MDETKQLAAYTLNLVRSATAPTDDATQNNIVACKQWLNKIQRGELVVVEPKAPKNRVAIP